MNPKTTKTAQYHSSATGRIEAKRENSGFCGFGNALYQIHSLFFFFNSWGRNIRHFITSTLGCAKLFTYHYGKVCNFSCNFVFNTTSYDVSHTLMKNYYTTADTTPYLYVPLHKQYELSNHLGNVLATVSARPRLIYDNQTFKYKEADVMSVSDYEPGGFPTPGRQFNSESYRFGHNTQEKVDEWNGTTGTHYTALFWEYDSRLIWRQNPDPKGTANVSPYACFNCNPILYSDVLGDIWGKPGDKKDNKDKEQADAIKKEFSDKKDEYQKTYESLNKQIENYSGDKSTPEFENLNAQKQESYLGMKEMESGIKEIEYIDADKNYYTFKPTLSQTLLKPNLMKANDNGNGTFTITINYQWGSSANKVHETRHAADIALGYSSPVFSKGSNSTNLFSGVSEYSAYARQYFYNKGSMPVKISTYKELFPIDKYLNKINEEFGRKIY